MGNTCFPRKSNKIVNKNDLDNAPVSWPICSEALVNTVCPCYNGLSIHLQLVDENMRPLRTQRGSSYKIFYRNVTKQEEDWCLADGNAILQFPGLIGRYCLLGNLTGGDTYQVKTHLVLNNPTGSIRVASEISTEIPLKSKTHVFFLKFVKLFFFN